jgi:hypothetical protein
MINQTSRSLNLKNDIIFKSFFARKGNERFLIDFLSSLLKIEIKTISIREEVNLEQLSAKEKGGRLDLQAELNDGIIVSIELQLCNHHNMENRTAFYSAKVLSRETERGTQKDKGWVEMAEKKNKTIENARLEMNYLTGDAAVRRLAELREKWDMDYNSGMNYAKKQGLKEGTEKKQKEIVRKMVEKKMPLETIIEITGLSKQEIETIVNQ